jgi:DNA-binding transcriptional regulator/RsmH inhibitor MraZ
MVDQLALEVDPACAVRVVERRGGDERTLRVGPLAEPEARALAAMLLNRTDEPAADGPWRCAIAGGVRVVSLERMA